MCHVMCHVMFVYIYLQVTEEGPASMYVFEGTDYSKEPTAEDRKAFDDLLSGWYLFNIFSSIEDRKAFDELLSGWYLFNIFSSIEVLMCV